MSPSPGPSTCEPPVPRVDVLGVEVSAVDMPRAVDEIASWVEGGQRHYVCVTGVHGVMESQGDAELKAIHNRSGLTTPDGMPMVWAAHYAGFKGVTRVYGPDLMLALCARAALHGWRCYLYGGKPGVAELLGDRLREAFPELIIAGAESPPFSTPTPEEDEATLARINAARPQILWVGLSTPKQERWMASHIDRLEVPAVLGVGAAFDIHAGLVPQAPAWVQRAGCEWLFRLAVEPRRLARRYLSNNPRFLLEIVRRPPAAARGPLPRGRVASD